jgi:hypothetical protein
MKALFVVRLLLQASDGSPLPRSECQIVKNARLQVFRRGDIGNRFRAAALALGTLLMLGGCTSFAGAVSDHWPTWAGGMPSDVPPRPGAPGYAEFISHQQAKDEAAAATAAKGGAAPIAATTPTGAVPIPTANNGGAQAMPPGGRRVDDQGVVQGGGLY